MTHAELQILAAMAIDLLLGDPRWVPHPVRLVGWAANRLEVPLRRVIPGERIAGTVLVILLTALTTAFAALLLWLFASLHPFLGFVFGALFVYWSIAPRDLYDHVQEVFRALSTGDLQLARERVGRIVGRDTGHLDESGITRAAVESTAESIVDGITAPLFYAAIAGPLGAVAYRVINTLDSTFGYHNERYERFGWAAAKLDDLVNFVPARLTAPVMCLATLPLRLKTLNAFRIFWRDAQKHTSPNAGYAEAAMAGALGVQLGGLNYYFGKPSEKPTIGDRNRELETADIQRAIRLALTSTGLFLLSCLASRIVFQFAT